MMGINNNLLGMSAITSSGPPFSAQSYSAAHPCPSTLNRPLGTSRLQPVACSQRATSFACHLSLEPIPVASCCGCPRVASAASTVKPPFRSGQHSTLSIKPTRLIRGFLPVHSSFSFLVRSSFCPFSFSQYPSISLVPAIASSFSLWAHITQPKLTHQLSRPTPSRHYLVARALPTRLLLDVQSTWPFQPLPPLLHHSQCSTNHSIRISSISSSTTRRASHSWSCARSRAIGAAARTVFLLGT